MKEKKLLEKGMYVIISHDLSNTEKAYGVVSEMRKMAGERHKVIDVWTSEAFGTCAKVSSYSWSAEDLIKESQILELEKEELFHFNIKELNI